MLKPTFKEFLINEARDWRQPKQTDFEYGKAVRGNALRRGMLVSARYNRFNQGEDFIEILGVSGDEKKYGEGGIKYNSVKECLQANGVRSLKELEEKDRHNEYGYHHYLFAKDIIDGDSGPWYYLSEGRWCRGTGAEPLSFTEIRYVPKQVTEARYHGNNPLPRVEGFDDYHEIEWRGRDLRKLFQERVFCEELAFVEGMKGNNGYVGLFYVSKPPLPQITAMVRTLLEEEHPDGDAPKFAKDVALGYNVYYDNVTGKLYAEP